MKIGAGPSILICSKARVCSTVKRHADLREVQLSCPTLTFLHKLQVYEVFSILFPNGRREKTCFKGHLSGKKCAWPCFRLGKTFEDERRCEEKIEDRETGEEISRGKIKIIRWRADNGQEEKRNIPSSETRDK